MGVYSYAWRFASIILLCFLFFVKAAAQESDAGTWNIITLKTNFSPKWSAFAEGQLRSLRFYNDFHYHEFKAGAVYKAHPNATVALAFGKYDTYASGGNFETPKNNAEYRLWPQFIVTQNLNKLKFENRTRVEFRFTSNGYRNRFRNRIGLSYPLIRTKEKTPKLEVAAYNELFFTNTEPYFERNRASVNLFYHLNSSSNVMLGYLQQFDYKINDETGKGFIQMGYSKTLNFGKKKF
jgi:hypothetical protein